MELVFKKMFLLAVLILVFLSACSSEDTSGEEIANQEGQTEITFMALTDWEDALGEVITAFEEENPDIKVALETYSFDALFETVEVKLGSESDDYDVMIVDGPVVANYTVKGYLEPLGPYLEENITENWIDSSVAAGTYQGELMAAPMNTSSQALFYNKDIFEEKGVTPPSFDTAERWTWDQTIEAAKQLTYDEDGDGATDVFGFTFEQVSRPYQILPLPQSLGAQPLGESGLDVMGNYDSPEMVEAGQFYYNLFNEWEVSPKITPDVAADYFKSGDVAMFVGGTWNTTEFEGMNYGIAPHPYFADGEVVTPTGSWHLGIPAFSENKEAAAKFIEFLSVGEGSEIWFELHGNLPSTKALLSEIESSEEYAEFPHNILRLAAYEAQNTAVSRPVSPGYSEFQSVFLETFDNIKNGQNPEESINNGAGKLDRLLEKYESLE